MMEGRNIEHQFLKELLLRPRFKVVLCERAHWPRMAFFGATSYIVSFENSPPSAGVGTVDTAVSPPWRRTPGEGVSTPLSDDAGVVRYER